jgi:hypothetical protein
MSQLRGVRSRLLAHENVESVELDFQVGDQRRNRAAGLREESLGL